MKRPAVFITYFQSLFQVVHVYQVLRSEYFSQKNGGRFNLISISRTLNNFWNKPYKKRYRFFDIFPKFLSHSILWQSFTIWKFLLKKWQLFENVNKSLVIWATTFARKPMKRSTVFMTYFQSSCHLVNVNKILLSENF